MTRDETLCLLRTHAPELQKIGVASLCLFGSVARNEARPDSDVDLFFDYTDPSFSLIEMVDVEEKLHQILGTAVDLTTRNGLHPLLKDAIESSSIKVF